MITLAKNPPLRWLITSGKEAAKENSHTVWADIGRDELLLHRSCDSLRLIIEWSKQVCCKEKPVLFIPEYYCYDTLFQIENDAEIIYYPIKESLSPDMKVCRELAKQKEPDIFLLVHYWGHILDGNDASVFCRQHNAVFIEDAVHVLSPDKRIGQQSDFILFSPWKLLGLPDGAILVIGKKNHFSVEKNMLAELFQGLDSQGMLSKSKLFLWKCKRLLLKIVPNIKRNFIKQPSGCKKEMLQQISSYSKKILMGITKEELLELGLRRKENALYILDFCKRIYGADPLIEDGSTVPYMAALRITDSDMRKKLSDSFARIGRIVSTWPLLPPAIPESSRAYTLAHEVVAIAVHDNLDPNKLAKKLKDISAVYSEVPSLKRVDKKEYDIACERADGVFPLLQSSIYGRAKEKTQKWIPEYYVAFKNGNEIACFMALKKRKVISIYRINQGILWLLPVTKNIQYNVYQAVIKKFTGCGKLLFFAPHEKRSGDSFTLMLQNGMKYRKQFFSTGYLKLCNTDEILRKHLDSKWRNQLKAAESNGFAINITQDAAILEQLLKLHIQHKKEKKYDDSGDEMTRALICQQALCGYFVAESDDSTLAFIMVALHGTSATYYIGWNSEKGYQLNLNKLLLWEAIRDLKKRGFRWFDLGGIDFVHTQGIAEFKMGTGCEYYELSGEFVG